MQQLVNNKPGLYGISAKEQSHAQITTSPVNQSHQQTLADTAIDGITLPITDSESAANYIGPLGNSAVRLDAVIGRVSGHHALSPPPKVKFYGDRGEFSGLNVAVNRRDAKRFSVRI